jgi:hypothetical protein
MNKREWLVSKGLAEGTRGRFSKEAEAAWIAHLYEQGEEALIPSTPGSEAYEEVPEALRDGFHYAKPVTVGRPKQIRKENSAYTVDEHGHLIGHDTCGSCKSRIMYCACPDGPAGLPYINVPQIAYVFEDGSNG